MAFPDGYTAWGGTAADFTTSRYDLRDGITLIRSRANKVTIWGGPGDDAVQVTDLYDHTMAPVTELLSAPSGLLRTFWAPTVHEELWASVQDGELVQLVPHTGPPTPWSAVGDKPATFPPSPHAHSTGDVSGLETLVTTRAGDQLGYEVVEDFTLYADGPLVGRKTLSNPGSGRLTWGNVGDRAPVVESGSISIPPGVAGTMRAYLGPLAADVNVIGMEFSHDGDGSGGLCCMAISDGLIGGGSSFPDMPVHHIAATTSWHLQVAENGDTSVEDGGIGSSDQDGGPLVAGTRYRVEVILDKRRERAYVVDHRGNVFTAVNGAFNGDGQHVYFQVLRSALSETRFRIHRVWADSRRIDPVVNAHALTRMTPPPVLKSVGAPVAFAESTWASVAATAAKIPLPSSRAVRVQLSGRVQVTTAGDFYLAVMRDGGVIGNPIKPIWAARGTGVFDLNEGITLSPADLASGRIGDPMNLTMSVWAPGSGEGSILAGGYDKFDVQYQPLPVL